MTKQANDPDGSGEGDALVATGSRAFLVTLHEPEAGEGAPFVAVQASHSNRSHRFDDLASAFRYLEGLDRPEGEEDDVPER